MAARKTKTPVPVEATLHTDKRVNLPTADAQEFVSSEVATVPQLVYPRDPSLDPQLVWKGKDEQDTNDLEVEAPPIYIQEKIDPRVLVENLRKTAREGEMEPELTLFATFDGLDELDLVDFYKHEANWSNRMILGDSLNVMASLSERESLRGKVQMIYLDPPYGIRFGSNWQTSTRKRDVKDGKLEDATREVEMIRAFRDTWELGIHSYLPYLRDRLAVSRDLLTDSGSVFVQIGDENVHLVRSLLDEIFGRENFVNLIPFQTTSSANSPVAYVNALASVCDFILWYAKDLKSLKYRQLYLSKELAASGGSKYDQILLPDGTVQRLTKEQREGTAPLPEGSVFRLDNLTSTGVGATTTFDYEFEGRVYRPGGGHWKTTRAGLDRLAAAGRIVASTSSLNYVRFIDDFPAFPLTNVWTDIGGVQSRADPKVYVVQTSTSAVQRCLLMTTDPGDLILDPTCGAGTTAYVAEHWGRRWITIDTSRVALALARQRLMGARFPYYLLADSEQGRKKEEQLTGSELPPDQPKNDVRRGFVYERIQHITLKSIANNPDITPGMSRNEIEAAVNRHADHELLVDRPYEDKSRVRVSGPFTVESLSPHRSLAFARGNGDEPSSEVGTGTVTASFEQTILENLRKAGIQNGRRHERLTFDLLEPYAGVFVQALGTHDAEDGDIRRVGIAIGPQYGTVGPAFIKDAAREAIRAQDVDLLCVLGFAFDPQAIGASDDYVADTEGFASVAAERSLGRIPVLLVRMNADLVMGDDLKKTGQANLFTVFGEPDLVLIVEEEDVTVELRGVDVYDPTTSEIRNNDVDQVALWMIDSDYNGESFFVRHCYFTGGQDPYRRLKTALKADIDGEAWATLYRTVSRPFPKPSTGKIAIKVINDYGDEVLKVYEVT